MITEEFPSPQSNYVEELSSYIYNDTGASIPEIGLHTYFDSPSAQETSFDDFSLKMYTPGDTGQAEAVPEL